MEDFRLIGFDYTNLQHKEVAIDPDTKALLTKSVFTPYPGVVNATEYNTLQEAIDAAYTLGYRYVWIPAGIYEIALALSIPANNFTILGAGKDKVTIKATSDMNALIDICSSRRHLKIGGFTLDGNDDKASHGLYLKNTVWFSHFHNIHIKDIASAALYLSSSSITELGTSPYWNLFEDIQCGRIMDRGDFGIKLLGDVNFNTFINCPAAGNLNAIKLMDFDFGGEIGVRGPSQNLFICPDCGGAAGSTGIKIEDNAHTNTFLNPLIEGVNLSMEIRHKSNILIGGVFEGNTTNIPSTPNGLDCYYYKIGANTYGSWLGGGGVGNLSELIIDAHKDWAAKNITNMGTIEHQGATLKAGVQTIGRCTTNALAAGNYSSGNSIVCRAPFRQKLTNAPSSITLSNVAETENHYVSSVSVMWITTYGFDFRVTTSGGQIWFGSFSKKYETVGN
ncbi:hypothetical protein ES702_01924 [subsurface metagenome]